jgi:arylsulfatase A
MNSRIVWAQLSVAVVLLSGVLPVCGLAQTEASVSVESAEPPASAESTPSPPPNVVILFADDMGYGDLGCYGNPVIRTPNLDRMAAEGMRFTQFYSASPACTASRYALLTGLYPKRSGFGWVLAPKSERGIHPKERTLAEELKAAGYATAAFGKWHLGRPTEYLPLQNGFDEYLGLPYSNDMQPPKWQPLPLIDGNEVVELDPDQNKLTRLYTERAVSFIRKQGDHPFFLYLPYAMPHVPLHAGPDFAGKSLRGAYGDAVEEIDWSAGEIMRTLQELGVAQNTLVFFTSDNGPWIIKGERGGSSGLLRDGKGSTWEGGMREPAIAWWPGKIAPGQVQPALASTLDLYATAIKLAGRQIPTDRAVDGFDLAPVLFANDSTRVQTAHDGGASGAANDGAIGGGRTSDEVVLPRSEFYYYGLSNELMAVRRGPWKLHIKTYSQTGKKYFGDKLPLLFNLERDPSEKYDRSTTQPEIVAELTELIVIQRAAVKAEGTFFDQ